MMKLHILLKLCILQAVQVKYVCKMVGQRAAMLVGAAIAALVHHMGRDTPVPSNLGSTGWDPSRRLPCGILFPLPPRALHFCCLDTSSQGLLTR